MEDKAEGQDEDENCDFLGDEFELDEDSAAIVDECHVAFTDNGSQNTDTLVQCLEAASDDIQSELPGGISEGPK